MSSDDAAILTFTVGPAIAGVIAIRLLFRHSATTGAAVVTPQVFAIIGGLVGMAVGMVLFHDRESELGRVDIAIGALALICGLIVGSLLGSGASRLYSRLNRGRTALFLLTVTFLGGSIGAPIGWLAGSLNPQTQAELEQLTTGRMMWGTAIGSGVGLILGLTEIVFRRRGAT